MNLFKSIFRPKYEYGVCGRNNDPARRNRKTGSVEFVLWNAGEQGHTEDYWAEFNSFWWPTFKKTEPLKKEKGEMILRFLHWISSKLEKRIIEREDGKPYLSRYKILGWMPGDKRKWPLSIYLHHFHEPDLDEACHDHPWSWSFSLVLKGGYLEEQLVECPCYFIRENGFTMSEWMRIQPRIVTAPAFNWVGRKFHRAARLYGKETWTLFIAGPKASSWGFYVLGRGLIPWRDRLRERGIEVPVINDSI